MLATKVISCVLIASFANCDEELLIYIRADVNTTSYLIPTVQETISIINNSSILSHLKINYTTNSDTPHKVSYTYKRNIHHDRKSVHSYH